MGDINELWLSEAGKDVNECRWGWRVIAHTEGSERCASQSEKEGDNTPMGAMCSPVKREELQISVYLLMRLNGWIDWAGGWMDEGGWMMADGTMMVNDVREETGRRERKDVFKSKEGRN